MYRLPHQLQQRLLVDGLGQEEIHAQFHRPAHGLLAAKCGYDDHLPFSRLLCQLAQDAEAIQPRQYHVHQDQFRFCAAHQLHDHRPVAGGRRHLKFAGFLQQLPQQNAKLLIRIRQQHSRPFFHRIQSFSTVCSAAPKCSPAIPICRAACV